MAFCVIRADMNALIGTLNLVIKMNKNNQIIPVGVKSEDNEVKIEFYDESQSSKLTCDIRFQETFFSHRTLQVPRSSANEYSFGLKLKPGSVSDILKKIKESKNIELPSSCFEEIKMLVISGKFACSCSMCTKPLFNSEDFEEFGTNVLPEIAELSWCSCNCANGGKRQNISDSSNEYDKATNGNDQHSDHCCSSSKFNGNSNDEDAKRSNDLFKKISISENCLILEGNLHNNFVVNDDRIVLCSGCKTLLGTTKKFLVKSKCKDMCYTNLTKLYLHSLSFSSSHSTLQMWPSSSEEFELRLSEVLVSMFKDFDCSRFVIESRNKSNVLRPHLLISLLVSDAIVYFHMSENLEKEIFMKPQKIMRVLTKLCISKEDEKTGKEWLKDFSVGNIEIPSWKVEHLLETVENNSRLMTSGLLENGFEFSFLKRQ